MALNRLSRATCTELGYCDVLQAVHSVTTRAEVCSVRVCETSLSVLELLLDLGVVSATDGSAPGALSGTRDEAGTNHADDDLSSGAHGLCVDIVAR